MADDGAMMSFWEIEVPKSLACTTHAHAEYKNKSESLRIEKWKCGITHTQRTNVFTEKAFFKRTVAWLSE